MTEQAKFEAWWESFTSTHEEWKYADTGALLFGAWQACATEKDKEIKRLSIAVEHYKAAQFCSSLEIDYKSKELKELKDHINKVWEDTYPNSAPAETMLALKNRVLNLAEDRNCWVFNARVANNKLNELEKK